MFPWFVGIGLPLAALGLVALFAPSLGARFLKAFPRCKVAGYVLCVIGWFLTAYEIDTIGIEVFDRFLKYFPFEPYVLAVILSVLMILWMENLLPIRGLAAICMLFPAEMFPRIRMDESDVRLVLVSIAYVLIVFGMFAMFFPWRIRQASAWIAESPLRTRFLGGLLAVPGVACLVLAFIV